MPSKPDDHQHDTTSTTTTENNDRVNSNRNCRYPCTSLNWRLLTIL